MAMTAASGRLDARLVVSRGEGFVLDVALAIPPGRTTALLGPNGAGKSTVVAAIAGLLPLAAGRIELGGRILDDPQTGVFVPAEERRVGVVFQDYVLFPHLTVGDNIAFGPRSRGAGRRTARRAAMRVAGDLDLGNLVQRRPRTLSGGQSQRVALARALAGEPDLLLLDEPLAALDVTTRMALRRTLADHLDDFPGPRLVITHDPTEAFLLADVIHVIENGVITQVGTADEIRLRPRSRYVADLAGANLFFGVAAGGVVTIAGGLLQVADTAAAGPVLVTIQPRTVALFPQRTEGSPRNTWETTVTRIERLGERVRVQLGGPLPLTVEITPGAADTLHLVTGAPVWAAVKATEIGVEPWEPVLHHPAKRATSGDHP